MELEFTDDQHELRDTVRTVLERERPMSLVREGVEKGVGADGLWHQMGDPAGRPSRWTRPAASALGWVELAVVLEELGRAVAPVPYLSTVTQFAPVVAEVDGGVGLAVVPAAAAEARAVTPLDSTGPVCRSSFDGVRAEPDRVLTLDGAAAWDRARQQAVGDVALETVGTCQAVFDVALEKARATAYFAAACLAEDDESRDLAASMAEAGGGDCQRLVAQEGIQILGGMGYTWEHDMHLYVKRARTGEAPLGSTHAHRAHVADLVGL